MQTSRRAHRNERAIESYDVGLPPPRSNCAGYVYLRRGETGDQRLLNDEDAMIRRLERRGFCSINIQDLELGEIHAALCEATVIVSLDGSHITHIYYTAPENAALVTMIPDDRFVDVHKKYCDCVGMRIGFLVCGRAGDGYDVDLERTLDLVPS